MKPIQTYLLNERPLTIIHSLVEDLSFPHDQSFVFDLEHFGVLDIVGDAATTYLQGQVSCDVNEVNAQQMRPGALCNLQGRLMALLDVVFWKGLHLILPKDISLPTQHNLSKSALFSRVSVQINTDIALLGLYIPNKNIIPDFPYLPEAPSQVKQSEEFCCYALSETLFILMVPSQQKKIFLENYAVLQQKSTLAWHYLELQILRMHLYSNTRGLFLPHRLGLQYTPYISFNKGCYKGQEIIARTHYRAKIKHTLKAFTILSSEPIFAGQKVFDVTKEAEIGEIVDYCPLDSERYFILLSILITHDDDVFMEQHQHALKLL